MVIGQFERSMDEMLHPFIHCTNVHVSQLHVLYPTNVHVSQLHICTNVHVSQLHICIKLHADTISYIIITLSLSCNNKLDKLLNLPVYT